MYRSTLPPSYLPKEHALDRLRGAIFETHLSDLCVGARSALNPKECSSDLLNTLAVFYSVDFYRNDFLEDDKRALIFNSIELKKIKGTIGALKKVFTSLGLAVGVEEWFEYQGEPFRFRLNLIARGKTITTELLEMLAEMVKEYKNVRSVLEEIRIASQAMGVLYTRLGSVVELTAEAKMVDGYTVQATQVEQIII